MDVGSVAKAITYLRKRVGYTQKDLASRLGVSDKAVSKWERGLGLPDISLLGKLSILLDTDTDSLLAGDVIHHDKGWHGLLILDEDSNGIGPETIIYDKPLIYYLISYYLLVGIRNIKIICSEHNRNYIENELTCDALFDFSITFGERIADAVEDSDYMCCDNLMLLFGRSLIYGVDMTRFFQRAMADKSHLTVLALPKGTKNASSFICFDANKKIVPPNHNDQLKTQYNYCDIPILFCPKTLFCKLYQFKDDPYDISWIFNHQDVYIEVLDRGFVEIPINDWNDVHEASTFVKIVQDRCGMILYCIEEVAWRRGLISSENMKKRAMLHRNSEYGNYVYQLIN